MTPDPNKMSVTTVTAKVKQYGDWISLSDVLLLTAIDNNLTEAVVLLGDQSGRTLDTITREVINGGTNVLYAPAGATPVTTRGRHQGKQPDEPAADYEGGGNFEGRKHSAF